jgi:hypothetical protein
MKKTFLILFSLALLLPFFASAQNKYDACPANYVASKGKCCPQDNPYYSRLDSNCCQKLECDKSGNTCSCTDPVASEEPIEVSYSGLVPCGKCVHVDPQQTANEFDSQRCGSSVVAGNPTNTKYMPCQFCHLFITAKAVLDFVGRNIFYLGVLMIVVGGAMIVFGNIFSPGNPNLISAATKIITSALIGLLIFFASYLIVNLFFVFVGVADTDLGGGIQKWFSIDCVPSLIEIKQPAVNQGGSNGGNSGNSGNDDSCSSEGQYKCGNREVRRGPNGGSNFCSFPYNTGSSTGACCICRNVSGSLEWRVAKSGCSGGCSLDDSGSCMSDSQCY